MQSVSCESGEQLVGAGSDWSPNADNQELFTSELRYTGGILTPTIPTGVSGRGGNDSGTDSTFRVQALCLEP